MSASGSHVDATCTQASAACHPDHPRFTPKEPAALRTTAQIFHLSRFVRAIPTLAVAPRATHSETRQALVHCLMKDFFKGGVVAWLFEQT
ncbi:MAG TPA: hypothetical protein VGA09_04285 [Candidatus Binatia bacterium]